MFAVYLAVTLAAAAVTGSAGVMNLIGHDYPKRQAEQLALPSSSVIPLGILLGAGAVGLLAGIVVPVLGTLAAAGLVLYFVCALGAHIRVRDRHLGPWALYFCLVAGALVVNVTYHGIY
ncbi:MAG TPA: DoxX family protein [Streptosporangiales bacterium]